MLRVPSMALLAFALPALALEACTGYAPSADLGAYCASDDECGSPFICVYGACYDPGTAALHRVSLEVVPSASSARPTQQFPDFVVSGQSRSEVHLAPTIHAHLRVEDSSSGPLAALVTAETAGAIPGRPLRVDERAASNGLAVLPLISGLAYGLRVQPDDTTAPPFRPGTLFANSDVDGPQNTVTLQGPETSTLLHVRGRVVISPSTPIGIQDLRVQLRALVGTPPERRTVSSSAITLATEDARGQFELLLPSDLTSGLQLHITPTSSNPFFPVLTLEGLDLDTDTDLGDIAVGDVGLPVEVSGLIRGPSGPVVGASVSFVGAVGNGLFSTSSVTGADGRYTVNLLPGLYQVVAVPSVTSSAGLSEVLDPVLVDRVAPGVTQIDLQAQPRARYSGTVRDRDGLGVRGATLRASRRGNAPEAQPGPADDVRTVFETRTDAQGTYELRVDPGLYELSVVPPSDALLPWRSDLLVAGLGDVERDVELYAAAPFGGRITDEETGDALAGGLVRAFLVLDDQRVVLVGEDLSDQSGDFSIVLPSFGATTTE
ncbi:MAG: carboxypeptidase-like regulatory domain-containing protein [Pseudomonadota bacterium]